VKTSRLESVGGSIIVEPSNFVGSVKMKVKACLGNITLLEESHVLYSSAIPSSTRGRKPVEIPINLNFPSPVDVVVEFHLEVSAVVGYLRLTIERLAFSYQESS